MSYSSRSGLNEKFSNLVQISNHAVLVIEIGRSLTKVGYSGEAQPRSILKTPKFDTTAKCNNFNQIRQQMSDFIFNIYRHHNRTSPQNHKVLIIEDVTANRFLFERIIQCMFVSLRVPVICAIPSLNLVQYATGCLNQSHLVVDIGHVETKITPVLYGSQIDLKNMEFSKVGIEQLSENLQEKYLLINKEQAEDILVRSCFVAPESKIGKSKAPTDITYRLSGLKTINIKGQDRNLYNEFFNPENSLSEKIVEAIKHCPIDTRSELYQNIIIIGGGSNFTGLHMTLKEEILKILPDGAQKIRIIRPKCNGNLVNWLGGSLYASVKVNLDKFTLLRDAYIKCVYGDTDLLLTNDNSLEITQIDKKENEKSKQLGLQVDPKKSKKISDSTELSEAEMFRITLAKHDENENFLPIGHLIIPDIFNGFSIYDSIDEFSLTLAQVMEHRKSPKAGLYSSASLLGADGKALSNKDYLKSLKLKAQTNVKLGDLGSRGDRSSSSSSKMGNDETKERSKISSSEKQARQKQLMEKLSQLQKKKLESNIRDKQKK